MKWKLHVNLVIKYLRKKLNKMNFLLTLLIVIVAKIIDVLPMIKMKLDKYSCMSAFFLFLFSFSKLSGVIICGGWEEE